MDVSITIDQTEIERFGRANKAVARALLMAGRDGMRSMRTASRRSIQFRKKIKVKVINDALVLEWPRGKEIDSMVWTMNVKGTRLPIIGFPGARQTSQGVTVAINSARRALIRHAFIARVGKGGHRGVFMRLTGKRKPIKELYTTRVADIFGDGGMVPAVFAQTMKSFNATFSRVLPLELAK